MGLDGTGEPTDAPSSYWSPSAESLVPPRAPSDPFDLRVSDVPSQAAYVPARHHLPRLLGTLTRCFSPQTTGS